MKLKKSIHILFLVFTLVPLYLFGIFMIYENDKRVEKVMRENLTAISGMQIFDIKNSCEAQKENLEIIADYRIVHDAINNSLTGETHNSNIEKEYLTNMLLERRSYNDYLISISVINKDFYIVASSEEYDATQISQLKKAQNTKSLDGGFYISGILKRETESGTIESLAAYQGVEENGEIIGYIVEEIEPGFFDRNRTQTKLWDSSTLYLLDGTDQIITAGEAKGDARSEFVTDRKERENYTRAWNKVDISENPSGEISYTMGGTEYITYYSTIDYTDWIIRVTINLSDYLDSKHAYRLLLGMTILTVSLILVIVNRYITLRLVRPIDNIADTLTKIQENQDYSLRVEPVGQDEIGMLTTEVNELLGYIEKENMQEKEQQRYLARKAERDPLTGVKNKKAIEEKLQDMVQNASATGAAIALGFLDIDDFKEYNTNYGHPEGDRVIRFVASVLDENINGIVGRNGGDEFIFGIGDIADMKTVEKQLNTVLDCLRQGMQNKVSGERMSVFCSIGVIVAKGVHLSYSHLVRCADEAMYRAKQNGKNCYALNFMIPEETEV